MLSLEVIEVCDVILCGKMLFCGVWYGGFDLEVFYYKVDIWLLLCGDV